MEPAVGDRANKQNVNFAELLAEALLSTGSNAIVATDRDGIIRFWNPGAERVFGHSRRDALGRSLDLIIPKRLRERHWQGFANVMQSGQTRYGEDDLLSVPALRNDGTTLSVQFTIAPLRKAGRMIGMAAIIRDVTQQFQETRELKRALSSLQAAAGGRS
jgi:PAS domain S-box-containing protein